MEDAELALRAAREIMSVIEDSDSFGDLERGYVYGLARAVEIALGDDTMRGEDGPAGRSIVVA
ncbi:hypothetical protein H6A18_09455 [Collinsella tanakaei]|uniref:hypothetical protein n=1 Tax=Collinsella tanakaei TaxID=626935 RepID=UPI001956DD2E|nr:hypothetical protein [Collinsella tanakaei]MBM6756727.1 hypothetical protein [Collinsella tanakaei]